MRRVEAGCPVTFYYARARVHAVGRTRLNPPQAEVARTSPRRPAPDLRRERRH